MKLRLAVLGMFLTLCIAPAFADSLSFKNVGVISGSGNNSGITLSSEITKVSFNGSDLGLTGQLDFNTGTFVGTLLGGGTFSGGALQISIDGSGPILFVSNFAGSLMELSHDEYELIGTFSTIIDGVQLNGLTKQFFELEREDGKLSFEDLHGKTCISPAAVPEPGTLTLLGTGLIGLGGMVRRKIASI
jgi:PEP-CTERM motif-containing protein